MGGLRPSAPAGPLLQQLLLVALALLSLRQVSGGWPLAEITVMMRRKEPVHSLCAAVMAFMQALAPVSPASSCSQQLTAAVYARRRGGHVDGPEDGLQVRL